MRSSACVDVPYRTRTMGRRLDDRSSIALHVPLVAQRPFKTRRPRYRALCALHRWSGAGKLSVTATSSWISRVHPGLRKPVGIARHQHSFCRRCLLCRTEAQVVSYRAHLQLKQAGTEAPSGHIISILDYSTRLVEMVSTNLSTCCLSGSAQRDLSAKRSKKKNGFVLTGEALSF